VIVLATVGALVMAARIVKPVEAMTKRLNVLGDGSEMFVMEDIYKTGDEIEILAESFAKLSKRATDYIQQITTITAEKERIGTELSLAKAIQASMLPHVFPPFPHRTEFDIYAMMDPAREVGGDFYDYYLIDDDHLGLVVADVSGKGIPAALFMMISKTILQNCAMLGKSPSEILEKTNDALCSNNLVEMFVTVWVGIVEISTGKLTASNAGHEYPVIKRADGQYEIYKDKHSLAVGAMEDTVYSEYEIMLGKGDRLFLYTDGVPEATDSDENMFGSQRMLDALNSTPDADPEGMLNSVKNAVNDFVQNAEQFDDLTMLGFEYRGPST
jgi:sigma-B regulation protein RsbU (phosphoserine phosphatase)